MTPPAISPAERVRQIPFSTIRKIFERARVMEQEGRDIARMEIGRPDFDTPAHIKDALKEALDRGEVHYAPNQGIAPLREAISRKLQRDNGLAIGPDGVLVTVGCKEAVFLALASFIDSGDKVIVPDPCWDTYAHTVTFLGGQPVPVAAGAGFEPDPEAVRAAIDAKTKAMVIVSPHNPTGAVYSPQTLEALAAIAVEHDLLVISDEIYEKLIYDDAVHRSIATFPGMAERTIVINGFSKAYAMDGWRLGYAAGPDHLIRPMLKAHQYTTNCVATFVQWGAVAAYEGSQEPVEAMRAEFDRRRGLVVSRLLALPGVELVEPKGAFYAFPRFALPGVADERLAEFILQEAGIACVPGETFGEAGRGHLRFSYATSYESIERGMDRLDAAVGRR